MNNKIQKTLISFSVLFNIIVLLSLSFFVYSKGGSEYLFKKYNQETTVSKPYDVLPYYSQKTDLFKTIPKSKGRIVFLGDSITDGCEWSELLENSNVLNRGIQLESTDGILERIRDITALQPSKLFIMVGINDIGFFNKNISDITENYKTIISITKKESPDTTIYIQSVLPVNTNIRKNVKNSDIILLNKELKAISISEDIQYIDLYSYFATKNNELDEKYSNDGIHLLGKGYLVWKDAIKDYL